ncbi:DUF2806 domain-containing protein [Chloroflexota bacterium]
MSDIFSLVKIDGRIVKPATELIKKISDAFGGSFKPWQIRRVAQAQADAEVIIAKAKIEITELQQRALTRFVVEESKKQDNIESITERAIEHLSVSSAPQDIEDDWVTNFFDKCRIVSDDDMQKMWAQILAGEANSPGTYSKRTVNALGAFSKQEAEWFNSFCSFNWLIGDVIIPLIFDEEFKKEDSIYAMNGIDFDVLLHLASIGLIIFEAIGLSQAGLEQQIEISYHSTNLRLEFNAPQGNTLDTGNCRLTAIGREISQVCSSKEIAGFTDYVVRKFSESGIRVSSPYIQQGI